MSNAKIRTTTSTRHKIYLASAPLPVDEEAIIRAAHAAWNSGIGTDVSITIRDIYAELGAPRGSHNWDMRYRMLSPQRILNVIKNAGFVPAASQSRKSGTLRYILAGDLQAGVSE